MTMVLGNFRWSRARGVTAFALAGVLGVLPAPATAQPQDGTLVVSNQTKESLKLILDGRNFGVAFKDQLSTFRNIPLSARTYALVNLFGDVRGQGELALAPGGSQTLMVGGPSPAPRPQPVIAQAPSLAPPPVTPGYAPVAVAPGAQAMVGYPPRGPSWPVAPSALRVVNRFNEPLILSLNGQVKGLVPPAREQYLGNLPAGSHRVVATNAAGLLRGTSNFFLAPGQTGTWILPMAHAMR
jgi:hypothetical protein